MERFEQAEKLLRERFPSLTILKDEPMSRHTSFRIGGPAPLLAVPGSPEELAGVCALLSGLELEPLLIGNGTNLLVEDLPLTFPVVQTHTGKETPELLPGGRIRASSGITLSRLAVFAQKNGLAGMEFAHGIPGSLGGAVYMNAGAYGGEMVQIVETTEVFDNGAASTVAGEDHRFGYRRSRFSDSGAVILSSVLKLAPGDPEEIGAKMEDLMNRRKSSQPLEWPSAGSAFKRPVGGYAAALIEECGLKGRGCGNARVSEKHAGFIINGGNATFRDVMDVIDLVRETVLREKGILLEPEVRIIRAGRGIPAHS